MAQLQVVEVGYGIANRYPDGIIEIHRKLKNYPALRRDILIHEQKHSDNEAFNKKDLLHDLTDGHQYDQKAMLKFVFTTPTAWTQFLPITYHYTRGLVLDINMMITWGITLGLGGLAWWIGSLF